MKITIRSFLRLSAYVFCLTGIVGVNPVRAAWDDFGVTTNVNGSWNQAANWTAGGHRMQVITLL